MAVTVEDLRDYEDHPSPIREAMKARLNGWAPQCGTTKLRSFEVSSCEYDTPYKERDIDDSQIQAWFEEDASIPQAAAGKLRLLYGKVDAECFPFSREAFATISNHLDLSLEHINVMNAEHDSVIRCWTDRRDPETPCPSYCTRSAVFYDGGANGYNYANTYLFVHNNPTKRWTHALLLQVEFIPHPEYLKFQPPYLESIIDYLRTHVHLVGYDPFFAATTLCKSALPLHQKMVIILSSRISTLDGRLNSLGPGVDPLELDFMKETNKIQSHTLQLSILREMIERQLLLLQRILDDKKTRKYQKTLKRNDSDKIDKVRQDVLDDVEMVADGVATDNHALLKWIDRELLTVNSLSIMVYNYMAVKEARVTCEIAKASRRDSSAMKTIASLTMIFLPGTAIASVLDTPFFVWDEGFHNVITRGFWLFWAITIPITAAVVIAWRLAVYLPWVKIFDFLMEKTSRRRLCRNTGGDDGATTDGSTWKDPATMC